MTIFGDDSRSSTYADNKRKDVILGKVPVNGSDVNTVTAEAEYSINFGEQQKKFCLSLNYNGSNSFFCLLWSKNLSI